MAFNAKWARDTAMASLPEHADLLEDIYEAILDAVMNHELRVVITADRFPDVVVSHLTEQGFSVSSGATAQVISWAAAIDGAPKPPSVPLTLVSTSPDNGASEVNELGTITFTFDRELDDDVSEALADLSGLTGDNEGVEVDAYTVAGSTLTVVLNRNIVENGDDITVHLRSGSVTADDDGGLQPGVSITFTMHTFVPDPLELVSTTPTSGDTDVEGHGTVIFNFDKALKDSVQEPATITGLTGDNEGVSVQSTTTEGTTVTVTLTRALAENGDTVTVTLPAGSVTAVDEGVQDVPATTTYTMHTFVPDPLELVSSVPEDAATDVEELEEVTFTFDKALESTVTGNATVSGLTGDNEHVGVDDVTVSGSTVTVTFDNPIIENGDVVTVTLPEGTVIASDGGLQPEVSSTFTMDTFVPDPLVLISTTPTNEATDVAERNTVTFDFDKPLAPTVTSNATITGADGVTVSDTTVNGSSVVVTLSEPLSEDGSTVTVTLPAGAVTAQDGGTQDSAATTAFTMAEPEPDPEPDPDPDPDPEDED